MLLTLFVAVLSQKRGTKSSQMKGFLRDILVRDYSNTQEVRLLLAKEPPSSELRPAPSMSSCTDETPMVKESPFSDLRLLTAGILRLVPSVSSDTNEVQKAWRQAFDKVAARYCALKSGRPRSITKRMLRLPLKNRWEEKIAIGSKHHPPQHVHHPVHRWDRCMHISLPDAAMYGMRVNRRTASIVLVDLEETEWTYDAGLLVYFDMGTQSYVLLDIESNTTSIIPFDFSERIVRRLRLEHSLLIIEWAKQEG